uniref:Uncharacterized protein n=1 Tax=Pararge aegeria TaxID=116150 RepID=S4PVF9_9NEOP
MDTTPFNILFSYTQYKINQLLWKRSHCRCHLLPFYTHLQNRIQNFFGLILSAAMQWLSPSVILSEKIPFHTLFACFAHSTA